MSCNPDRSLWQEVLLTQVDDALLGVTGIRSRKRRVALIGRARTYLTNPTPDLETVCSLAGLEMGALIEAMRAKIANAPSPAELAGKRKVYAHTQRKRPEPAKPKPGKIADRPLTLDGTALTMQQWADRTGLTVMQIYSRLNQGWTVERALTQPFKSRKRNHNPGWGFTGATNEPRAAKPKAKTITPKEPRSAKPKGNAKGPITFNGATRSIREWAKVIGVEYPTLANRIRNGWEIEAALTTPVTSSRKAPGVGLDFHALEGTGAGRSAQDRPDLSFSPIEKVEA